jgi:hypothetical protein
MKRIDFLAYQKWVNIALFDHEDGGSRDCAWCAEYLFNGDREYDCTGCPIREYTGHQHCEESPYRRWTDHYREHHTERPYVNNRRIRCEECQKLANEMVKFIGELI